MTRQQNYSAEVRSYPGRRFAYSRRRSPLPTGACFTRAPCAVHRQWWLRVRGDLSDPMWVTREVTHLIMSSRT